MSNSLFTGVSGLRINQEMLDVVGNNLANSNTTAFKSQRMRFSDLVYQTVNQATSASSNSVGGTNPIQIGLGAQVSAIDANLGQGSLEATGRDLDLAMQGNGFFVARNGTEAFFTRAGAFGVDSQNFLVDPANGFRVQRFGTVGEGSSTSPSFQVSGNNDIRIPIGAGIPGNATGQIILQGNLSANAIGPRAQVLTSAQAFTAGGVPATLATLLNSLDDSLTAYGATDVLEIEGVTAGNVPVSTTLPVTAASTLGDLIAAINANFPGSLAALDANGRMEVQANSTGPTSLNVSVNDAAGNAGGMSWGSHTMNVTTFGKDGDTVKTGIEVFDGQGTAHNLNIVFQKQANNVWDLSVEINSSEGVIVDPLVSNITFNEDGSFRQLTGTGLGDATISLQFNGFSTPQQVGFYFGASNAFDGLTQVGGSSSAVATGQDGFAAGYLTSLSIGQDGIMNGVFTNGRTLAVAQIAIATFANAAALNRVGDNYYGLSSESGPALLGAGLAGGRGAVQQKALESSNVDVSLEFTRLIIAQRGFQVNARVITASDQILQELANILR
jgi:flagellar hook protein FlgE